MDHCCNNKESALTVLREKQGRVLKIVLVINALMFIIEFISGLRASSMALLGDSLDMLGDAIVYGFSLFVLTRNAQWRARASLSKGLIMLGFGLSVLVAVVFKILYPVVPAAETMGLIGLLVLAANLVCLFLLTRHRADDLNMRSVWLCSRNDIVANVSVLIAAALVAFTQSIWPDIIIGLLIAVLFLRSAFEVTTKSIQELKAAQSNGF